MKKKQESKERRAQTEAGTTKKRPGAPPKQNAPSKPVRAPSFTWLLGAGVALLVVLDLMIDKHPYFPWEGYPLFYGAYAFFCASFLILGAKYIWRFFVIKPEDYYDR